MGERVYIPDDIDELGEDVESREDQEGGHDDEDLVDEEEMDGDKGEVVDHVDQEEHIVPEYSDDLQKQPIAGKDRDDVLADSIIPKDEETTSTSYLEQDLDKDVGEDEQLEELEDLDDSTFGLGSLKYTSPPQTIPLGDTTAKILMLGTISQPQLRLLGVLLFVLVLLLSTVFACWWYYSDHISHLYTHSNPPKQKHTRRKSSLDLSTHSGTESLQPQSVSPRPFSLSH